MPKTKKVQAQLDQKIEDEDEDKDKKPKPQAAVRRPPTQVTEIDNKALRDMLARLASMNLDDLKQLTDLPLKLIDPIAKGVAYYDSTMPIIEEQCGELLDWYIEKCDLDITRCDAQIKELQKTEAQKAQDIIDGKIPPKPVIPNVKKRKSIWTMIFGEKKVKVTPDLEIFDLNVRKAELEERKQDLLIEKQELAEADTDGMFFKKWGVNLFLNRRSLGGHVLDSLVSLADAQIVTQGEGGQIDKEKVFFR